MEQISGMLLVVHLPFLPEPLYLSRNEADDKERVLKDASMMIPRTKVNLERAVEELDDLVVSLPLFEVEASRSGLMAECTFE